VCNTASEFLCTCVVGSDIVGGHQSIRSESTKPRLQHGTFKTAEDRKEVYEVRYNVNVISFVANVPVVVLVKCCSFPPIDILCSIRQQQRVWLEPQHTPTLDSPLKSADGGDRPIQITSYEDDGFPSHTSSQPWLELSDPRFAPVRTASPASFYGPTESKDINTAHMYLASRFALSLAMMQRMRNHTTSMPRTRNLEEPDQDDAPLSGTSRRYQWYGYH